MQWDGLQPSVKRLGWESASPSPSPMVHSGKKVACPLQVGGEFLPQVEEFKYLGVLFTSEGRMEREIERQIGAASAVMRSMYRSVVEKELSCKAKLSIYQSIYMPTLTYGHELWVMTERTRSLIQVAEMSFLRRVAGRSPEIGWGARSLGRSSEVARASVPDAFWTPSWEVFWARPTVRRLQGRPRTRWRNYVSRLVWEHLGIPPEEQEEVSREREVWASLLRLLPPRPGPR